MESSLIERAKRFLSAQRKKKMWYRAMYGMAAIVVFVTTYMLILPAITMERETICGKEEHTHTEECYTTEIVEIEQDPVLICTAKTLEIHKHTDSCYTKNENGEKVLTCGQADFVLHTHDKNCYNEAGDLVCTLDEVKEHIHDNNCYETKKVLVCEKQESAGHSHTKDCYTKEKGSLICDAEEHTHGGTCYDENGNLVCEKEEHTHSDKCYKWEDKLVCSKEESEGHSHDDSCYETVKTLKCSKKEAYVHKHTDNCYKNGVLTCGKLETAEHQHSEACFETPEPETEEKTVLVCEKEEHVHEDECFAEETEAANTFSLRKTTETAADEEGESQTDEAVQGNDGIMLLDEGESETSGEKSSLEATEGATEGTATEAATEGMTTETTTAESSGEADEMPSAANGIDLTKYITSVTMKKEQNNFWADIDASGLTDGDKVQVAIDYKVSANIITADNPTLTYQLPDGIRLESEESGIISGTIGGVYYENLGTYTITTDGLITLTFNDTFLLTDDEFVGEIKFQGYVALDEGEESKEIQFKADGTTYVVYPKSDPVESNTDLSVSKTASKISEDGKIIYTIIVSSEKGTGEESVIVNDVLSYSGLTGITVGTPTVTKTTITEENGTVSSAVPAQDYTYTSTTGNGEEKFSFVLPALAAGESYTITYEAEIGEISGNGYAKIDNTAQGYHGNWNDNKYASVSTEISKTMIEKTGSPSEDKSYITWTIYVNPNRQSGVAGTYTLTDLLDGEKIDLSNATVQVSENGWEYSEASLNENGTLTIEDGKTYKITYITPTNFSDADSFTATNSATITEVGEDGESGQSYGTGDIGVIVTPNDVLDSKWGDSQTVENGMSTETWKIKLWPKKDSEESIIIIDKLTDTSGNVNASIHYTTKELLESSLKGIPNGVSYTLTCYDADGNEVTDDTTSVVSFKLVLNSDNKYTWPSDSITIIYQSMFEISNLSDGETITVKNTATVDDVSRTAAASYTQPQTLFKYVYGVDEHGNGGWRGGSWNFTYDADTNTLRYRIVVKPDSTGAFTVTDTIPEGMTLSIENVSVTFTTYGNWDYKTQGVTIDGTYTEWSAAEHATITRKDQVLTVKMDNWFWTDKYLAIDYTVTITDDYWNSLINSEKTYTNTASWNGKEISQESTVTRDVPDLDKTGVQGVDENDKVTNQVTYYVTINPAGETLNGGQSLTLTDTLSSGHYDASLLLDSVKLYSYNSDNTSGYYVGKDLSASAFTFNYDDSSNTFTVTVPDSTPCVLVYTYVIDDFNNYSSTQWSNKVTMMTSEGQSSSATEIKIKEATSSATVTKQNQITIIKVDAERYQTLLSGAKFKMYYYDGTKSQWIEEISGHGYFLETDSNGKATFTLGDCDPWTLHYFYEYSAPEGYRLNETKYYFIIMDDKDTADNWWNSNFSWVKDLGISRDEIKFIPANTTWTVYVPDTPSTLKVTKLWLDSDGNPITGTKDVQVQLYQNKLELGDTCTVTVYFSNTSETLTYQVAKETSFSFYMQGWSSEYTVNGNSVGAADSYTVSSVTEDVTLTIGNAGWPEWKVTDYFIPSYTAATYVSGDSVAYEGTNEQPGLVTLTAANSYVYTWENLPTEDDDGNPVYYTVQEVGNLSGYTVSYLNNNGIQTGEITITNKANEVYVLPETGGSGILQYLSGGFLLMLVSILMYIKKQNQERGKQI